MLQRSPVERVLAASGAVRLALLASCELFLTLHIHRDDLAVGTLARASRLVGELPRAAADFSQAAGFAHAGQVAAAARAAAAGAFLLDDLVRTTGAEVRGGCVGAPDAWHQTQRLLDHAAYAARLARAAGDAWAAAELAEAAHA